MPSDKQMAELMGIWGVPFARAFAEFVRSLTERSEGPVPGTFKNPSVLGDAPLRAFEVLPPDDDPAAARRARAAHAAHQRAVRAGTAEFTDFDPAVPAKRAGGRLREIFKERGIKQVAVARKLGVAPSVISRVLKHPERSRLATIRQIAEAAEIPLSELI